MVLVIEGGRADGTDLVMGKDERLNPFSRVNGHGPALTPKQGPVPILELGNGNAISAHLQILPRIEGENVVFHLMTMAGRVSEIAGFQARPLLIAEIGKMGLVDLQAAIDAALNPAPEVTPA